MALKAVVHSDERRTGRAVSPGEILDGRGWNSTNGRHLLGRVSRQDSRAKLLGTDGHRLQVIPILELVTKHDVHHREGERRIASGPDRDVLVAGVGRARPAWIDCDDSCAPVSRLSDEWPEVRVRRERVGSPKDDEPRPVDGLGIGSHSPAIGDVEGLGAGCGADGPVETRRSDGMKEPPVHRFALDQAHRSGVRVGEDRLRTIRGLDDALESVGNDTECLVPARSPERGGPFRSGSNHRVKQPFRVVSPLGVTIHFGAEKTVRVRVIGIPRDLDCSAIPHRHQHRAGVGTVVGAGGAYDPVGHRLLRWKRRTALSSRCFRSFRGWNVRLLCTDFRSPSSMPISLVTSFSEAPGASIDPS